MGARPFTSEAYSQSDRPNAWEDVLGAVGLTRGPRDPSDGHASAVYRETKGVTLARLLSGPQTLATLKRPHDLPLIVRPLSEGMMLGTGGGSQAVRAGDLAILPREQELELVFQRELRAIVLAIDAQALQGRRLSASEFGAPRILLATGLAGTLLAMMDHVADGLESFAEGEWIPTARCFADLAITLVATTSNGATFETSTSTQSALLRRVCATIDQLLTDPELSPARVAQIEGISTRYLQRIFEGAGDSFTSYLRERRLQRIAADLTNPADAHRSVSEIAFRYGFNDAAHFSRAFRARFGLSPRAFRLQELERSNATAAHVGQRGWPHEALVRLRSRALALDDADRERPTADARPPSPHNPTHHHLPVHAGNVHWGFLSRSLEPVLEIASGDTVTVETLSQHASDAPDLMITGDESAESVFAWTAERKNVDRRGAGPMDASIFGRGAGEGFGVHICTGPIAVKDAMPGDVLEVRILDIAPRPSCSPGREGRVYGSGVAAWWGYHYSEFVTDPKPRETITIYEIFAEDAPHAKAMYSYRWEPQVDPFGVLHSTYDYPGIVVPPKSVKRRHGVMEGIRIPLRPHFGVIAVAPKEAELVDSVPPAYFGGNLDNWRLGEGAAIYLPVSVPGALLSVGDPHATQGDGEIGGTAIECSMTGTFRVTLHKKKDLPGLPIADLNYPLIETRTDWVLMGFSHPNYLAEFGAQGQSEVYAKSSLDLAMKDAFRKMRRFLMSARGLTEDEAVALMSAAVDFGVTQVVDGNWGVHAIVSKRLFETQASS
jgi:acetamidase/formamidase/AraC-like DNA-binding protein